MILQNNFLSMRGIVFGREKRMMEVCNHRFLVGHM